MEISHINTVNSLYVSYQDTLQKASYCVFTMAVVIMLSLIIGILATMLFRITSDVRNNVIPTLNISQEEAVGIAGGNVKLND